MNTRFLSLNRALAALAVVAIAALALSACGDDDDTGDTAADTAATTATTETTEPSAGGGGETVAFEADPGGALAYTETDLTAKAGEATIEFDNPSSTGHDVVIESESGDEVAKTDVITDSSASTTADLQPGTYTFYCSVPGHQDAGMEGTLTVK